MVYSCCGASLITGDVKREGNLYQPSPMLVGNLPMPESRR